MKKILIMIILGVSLFSGKFGLAQSSEKAHDEYTFKSVQAHNNTWGYDIYVNDILKIHQPNIPGKPGKEGFKTKEDAEKVAMLVIEKMKKGVMPPTVTTEELKNLGV